MTRVLTIDGGGLFGAGPAEILARAGSLENVDIYAGTSIGSIITCAAAFGVPMDRACRMFREEARTIFPGRFWRRLKPFTPRYPDKGLNRVLRDLFDNRLFGEASRPTFVVAGDMISERPKVFYSRDASDAHVPVWEVVRRSAAAPTYFSPWKGMVDGGLFANNPSMVAIAGAAEELGIRPIDLQVFSIGCGYPIETHRPTSTLSWTHLHWGVRVISMLLEGGAGWMHDYFSRGVLPNDAYTRIQFPRQKGWKMDDPRVVERALVSWEVQIAFAATRLKEFLS